ncbi:uncharacterized protein LOC126252239 [Schistocerca nitens]|uniref:uncharacterized protein LOC126252239 n=1 Tax=Schistocerca nitens TaxID=7011 RepID=UPI002118824C|nr:uncharacterized protein LOC126252239 [Schistocerca nitens]
MQTGWPEDNTARRSRGASNATSTVPPVYPLDGAMFPQVNDKNPSGSVRGFNLVRGWFQPRLPTSLPPPGQQQQPSPLPRRQPVQLMPPAQLHPGGPQVVAPAPAVPLQSPPPSELMDVDPSAGPPSQAVAVQPVLQPLSLGTPKESDTAVSCPAPTRQPSPQRQETLPLFVGPDAVSRPVPEAAPVVTGVHPDLGFQSVFPEAPRSQCWDADRGLPPTTVSAPVTGQVCVLEVGGEAAETGADLSAGTCLNLRCHLLRRSSPDRGSMRASPAAFRKQMPAVSAVSAAPRHPAPPPPSTPAFPGLSAACRRRK